MGNCFRGSNNVRYNFFSMYFPVLTILYNRPFSEMSDSDFSALVKVTETMMDYSQTVGVITINGSQKVFFLF